MIFLGARSNSATATVLGAGALLGTAAAAYYAFEQWKARYPAWKQQRDLFSEVRGYGADGRNSGGGTVGRCRTPRWYMYPPIHETCIFTWFGVACSVLCVLGSCSCWPMGQDRANCRRWTRLVRVSHARCNAALATAVRVCHAATQGDHDCAAGRPCQGGAAPLLLQTVMIIALCHTPNAAALHGALPCAPDMQHAQYAPHYAVTPCCRCKTAWSGMSLAMARRS